jgi:hypothetical protein
MNAEHGHNKLGSMTHHFIFDPLGYCGRAVRPEIRSGRRATVANGGFWGVDGARIRPILQWHNTTYVSSYFFPIHNMETYNIRIGRVVFILIAVSS